jgi:hypothetical protein
MIFWSWGYRGLERIVEEAVYSAALLWHSWTDIVRVEKYVAV